MVKAKMVKGQPAKNESFSRINVILCGDFHQLPPVAMSPTQAFYFPSNPERDSAKSQLRRAIYMEFTIVVILKEQMHVTDPEWHRFLEHLCYGWVEEKDIEMLQSLIVTNKKSLLTDFQSSLWNNASLVALHQFSSDIGNRIIACRAEDMIKGEPLTIQEQYRLATQGTSDRETGKQCSNQDLLESIDLTVGMKVMVTQNVETNLDIANGTQGSIVGIILHPDEPISSREMGPELQCLPLYILVKLDQTWAQATS
ncbi:hypothetical protein J3A83DRAFT_4427358 [Scleroderma citrinum]